MDVKSESQHTPTKHRTSVERKSDREAVVTRVFNAPVRLVYEAWTRPELFKRWWVPKSVGVVLLSCELDVRTGGKYRLVFQSNGPTPMEFFGKYLEVIPNSRIVWTNDESHGAGSVTTTTFEEKDGKTLVTVHELFPTKEALEEALVGSLEPEMMRETHAQLEELLVELSLRS